MHKQQTLEGIKLMTKYFIQVFLVMASYNNGKNTTSYMYVWHCKAQVSAFCSLVPRPYPSGCFLLLVHHFLVFLVKKRPGDVIVFFKWLVRSETGKYVCIALHWLLQLLQSWNAQAVNYMHTRSTTYDGKFTQITGKHYTEQKGIYQQTARPL